VFTWLARFIEHHPHLHRASLVIWRLFPPRLAGLLKGLLSTSWTVGAVAVMIDEAAIPPEVLLVEHSYRTRGAWGLPGGALESNLGNPLGPREAYSSDDILESTLRREVYEELGIEIEVLRMVRVDAVPYVPEEPGPYRLDFFYRCTPKEGFAAFRRQLDSGSVRPRSPEVKQMRLVPWSRLDEYDLYSSDARFLLKDLPRLNRMTPATSELEGLEGLPIRASPVRDGAQQE
jgi:8-oxo-dGTP pyrophosphatase MutT (NUDIX family)